MARSLIICVSIHHGNTLKIAKALAEVLRAKILSLKEARLEDVEECELLGLGSGIYYGKHHESILEFAKKLPKASNKPAFIFSTSGLPRIPLVHDYHKPLAKILAEKGFKIIGEFTCRGYSTHGPLKAFGGISSGRPSEKDLEEARSFAESLLEKLGHSKP